MLSSSSMWGAQKLPTPFYNNKFVVEASILSWWRFMSEAILGLRCSFFFFLVNKMHYYQKRYSNSSTKLVRDILLDWKSLLLEKSRKKISKQDHYVYFGWFGRWGMKLHLGMKCCPWNGLEPYFFLWLETKIIIKNGPLTFVDFIDWWGLDEDGTVFLYILFVSFCATMRGCVSLFVYLGTLF